jgi:type II secretory pathway predicted ATPase ExeA
MLQLIDKSTLKHFGIDRMKFFWSQTMDERIEDIEFAVKNNEMLIISGAIGAGKTELFEAAKMKIEESTNVKFIYVSNYFKEHVNIASIINALILDLSDESPRRDLEARSRQVTRIVGKKYIDEGINICLVIEEAHRVHPNTLRALKELREAKFAGKSPLFSTILIGHPQLQANIETRKEAYWRSHTMQLDEAHGWMEEKERINYLRIVFGEALTADARKRIAQFVKNPLEMVFYVKRKMAEAKKAGKHIIDSEVVKPSLLELKEAMNLSLKEIAKESGMGKTTIHDILHSEKHPQTDVVRAAIDRLGQKKKTEFAKAVINGMP